MRTRFRLTARQVETAKPKDGKVTYLWDGGSLGLRITPSGSKSWVFRKRIGARVTEYGLGPYPAVSLAEARNRAEARRHQTIPKSAPLFSAIASMVIERAAPGMATQTVEEWRSTLGRLTTLNKTPVDKIDVPEVRAALPLDRWEQFPVQTKNTLARVARVLDAAAGDGHRDKYNPAEWRWHKAWVPARPKAADEEKHHPAMPWQDVPAFVQQLRARKDDLAARALEFLILTGARTDEVTGKVVNKEVRKAPMTWSEIDRAGRLWRIPGSRMKRGVRHVVPLSEAAIHLLKSLPRRGDAVFEGLNYKSFDYLMRKQLKVVGASPHGFRSSFSDWAIEQGYSERLVDLCLAHKLKDAVEAAYNRTNRVTERIPLMQAWSEHVHGTSRT